MSIREVAEGVQVQGEDETITYNITTTNWASSPTNVSMVVKRVSDDTDVTSTAAPSGSISVNGDVITLKPITALTDGERYRVEVKFTASPFAPGEFYFMIDCEE